MSDPVFLTVDDVLQLHEDALEADGGAAGLRLDDTVLAVAKGEMTRHDAARVLREVAGIT